MPVMRGSLRPSGDGSIKSFIIILTVIGFLCFIYYKLKISPGCVGFMAEINAQRAEINRLTSLVKNLDELIQNQKEENRKMSAQKDSKDNELAAARTIEIDGLKQIAQLKNDVKVAESKLETCGPTKNLGISCVDIEEKYKQEIRDLKATMLQLKIDSKNQYRPDTKHDGAKEVPEYPQKDLVPFTRKQNLPSEVDKQFFHKNDGREERNELLNTVEFTSSNSSKSKTQNNFEETLKPLKSEAPQETDEEKEEVINFSELKNIKAKKSKLVSKKLSSNRQEDPADPDESVVGQIPRIKSGKHESIYLDLRNNFQNPADDDDDRQMEGKGQNHQRILGKDQKDSAKDQNKFLKEQPENGKVVEGFKYGLEKDETRLLKGQPAFGIDHGQNPPYHVKEIKRKRHRNESIIGTDSKRGHNQSENDRQDVGREQDKNYPKSQDDLKDEQIPSVPDAWNLFGQNDSVLP